MALRPRTLLATDDAVWVLDEFWPAAARLDPTGRVLGTVGWPQLPPPVSSPRPAATDATHLWVQCEDRVGRVGPTGPEVVVTVPGATLLAATGPGAWLAELRPVDVGDPRRGMPAPPLRDGRIVLVTPEGVVREAVTDRPVRGIAPGPGGLRLDILLAPPTPKPMGLGSGLDHHRTTVLVPWVDLRSRPVRVAAAARAAPRERPVPGLLDPAAPAWVVDGVRWRVGAGPVDRGRPLDAVAVATDAAGQELRRVPLGTGHPTAGLLAHGRLWFAVDGPGDGRVVALDPRTAEVRTVLADVDIGAHHWPRPGRPPEGAERHARRWVERAGDLERSWHPADGPAQPLSRGLADAVVDLVGTWPDRALQVTFRHPWYPAGVLRRIVPLFDRLGRPVEPDHWDIVLMEDLDTSRLPPPSAAVDGVLLI